MVKLERVYELVVKLLELVAQLEKIAQRLGVFDDARCDHQADELADLRRELEQRHMKLELRRHGLELSRAWRRRAEALR